MKKNKVVLAGLAGLALVAAIAPAALADNATATPVKDQSTTVKYAVTTDYQWSVPSEVDFGANKGVNKTSTVIWEKGAVLKVTKNVIPDGTELRITIAGKDGAFQIANGNTTLNYTVSTLGTDDNSTTVTSGDKVLTVPAGTNTANQDLCFTLSTAKGENNVAEVAGSYTGTAVFTAQVVKA